MFQDFLKWIGFGIFFVVLVIFTWFVQMCAIGYFFNLESSLTERKEGGIWTNDLLVPRPGATRSAEHVIPPWVIGTSLDQSESDEFDTSLSESSFSSSEGEFLLPGTSENDDDLPDFTSVSSLQNSSLQNSSLDVSDLSLDFMSDESDDRRRTDVTIIQDRIDGGRDIWTHQREEYTSPESTHPVHSNISSENSCVRVTWCSWSNGSFSSPIPSLHSTFSSDDETQIRNMAGGSLNGRNMNDTGIGTEHNGVNQPPDDNNSIMSRSAVRTNQVNAESDEQLAIQMALHMILMVVILLVNGIDMNNNDVVPEPEPEQEIDLGSEDNTYMGLDSINDDIESSSRPDSPLSWSNFVTGEIPEVEPQYDEAVFELFAEEYGNNYDNYDANFLREPDDYGDNDDAYEMFNSDDEISEDPLEGNSEEFASENHREDVTTCQCQGACDCALHNYWEAISSSNDFANESTNWENSSCYNSRFSTPAMPDILQNLPEGGCQEYDNLYDEPDESNVSDDSDFSVIDLTKLCKKFYLNHMEPHEESSQSYLTQAMENHIVNLEGINILQLAVVYIKLVHSARRLARLILYNVSTDLFSNMECGAALLEFQTMFNRIVDNEAIHDPQGAMELAYIYHTNLSRSRILERCEGTWVEDLVHLLSDIFGHQSTLSVDFYVRQFRQPEYISIAEMFVNISSCLRCCLEFGQTVLTILAASFRYWGANEFNILDDIDSADDDAEEEEDETYAEIHDFLSRYEMTERTSEDVFPAENQEQGKIGMIEETDDEEEDEEEEEEAKEEYYYGHYDYEIEESDEDNYYCYYFDEEEENSNEDHITDGPDDTIIPGVSKN